MSIGQSFDQTAGYYDGWMKKALPGYADLFSTALHVIPFPAEQPISVLDLGAGTGLFSQFVLGRYPNARFTLYDLAEKLLEIAKTRFQTHAEQFSYVTGDYRDIEGVGKYDLVLSSMSIHHLSHPDKQRLFATIHHILRAPGAFVNIDQIRGETPYLQTLYWEQWLAHVRQMGGEAGEIQSSIQRRQTYDQDAALSDQLAWLKAAGFENVDCVYKNYFVGVFLGMKTSLRDQ